MNKFSAIVALVALLASACIIRAEEGIDSIELEEDSQSSINPTDSEELAGLEGKNQIFTDFCLSSRDYIRDDLKRGTNNLAANVFTLFFRSAEQMGLEALNTQSEASERLSEQLRNPETPVSETDDIVEAGRRNIQEAGNNVPKSLFQAITSALAATGTSIAQNVRAKIMEVRQRLGMDKAIGALADTCSKVAEYEEELRSRFAAQLQTIAERDPTMANTRLDQVQCLTSKRILKIEGLCKFARIAQGPLMKILTYKTQA